MKKEGKIDDESAAAYLGPMMMIMDNNNKSWHNSDVQCEKLINIEPTVNLIEATRRLESKDNFADNSDELDFNKTLQNASSFEELQKSSRDLGNRLHHEKIIKGTNFNTDKLKGVENSSQQCSTIQKNR